MLEENRNKGYETQLVTFWEKEMQKNGYKIVLTSTQSNEKAQYFYRKMGYLDCGNLTLPNEPLELILLKALIYKQKYENKRILGGKGYDKEYCI